MEKDKLEEGKKVFTEDKAKYEKFKLDLQAKSHQTEEESQLVSKQIERFMTQIHELRKLEGESANKISKIDEEIITHKASKKFLDVLAIASGNKIPVNQKKRKLQKMAELTKKNAESTFSTAAKQVNQATFMTQASKDGGSPKKSNRRPTINMSATNSQEKDRRASQISTKFSNQESNALNTANATDI